MEITDYVAVTFITALLVSLVVRATRKGRNPGQALLWCQFTVIATVFLSISWVFPSLDRWFGGRSYLNLISHLMLVLVYYIYAHVVATPLLRGQPLPLLLRPWVFLVSAAGTIATFFAMRITMSSRGADEYMHQPSWLAYWIFSTMGLWLVAFQMVPLLVKAIKSPSLRPLRWSYSFMTAGYSLSILMAVGYAISWVFPELIGPREVLVLGTQLCLVMALILVPFAKHKRLNREAEMGLGQAA